MVKVAGDIIERVGGLASGMSGSPVYIDGKLLGAIAYGYAADPTIALVTPIEQMLELLRVIDASEFGNRGYETGAAEAGALGEAVPIASPLMVSGLGDRALERLTKGLGQYHLVPSVLPVSVRRLPIRPWSREAPSQRNSSAVISTSVTSER